MAKGPAPLPPETLFWRNVQVRGEDDCWPWKGATQAALGYGHFTVRLGAGKRQHVGAHRFSWSIANGPIPDGAQILHSCDNPPCVNPRHLRLGSFDANMADRHAKGRTAKAERHSQAKTDWATVKAIRVRAAKGESHTSIARDVGLVRQTVSRIVRGELWPEVQQ